MVMWRPIQLTKRGVKALGLLGLTLVVILAGCVAESVGAPGPTVVFTELRGATTTVWQAPARQPSDRVVLAHLEHREGFGVRGQLSPEGDRLAYTLLPAQAADPVVDASLGVLELGSGRSWLLQEGVDLRSRPVWSPDGERLAFRRTVRDTSERATVEIHLLDVSTGASSRLVADGGALGLYPIGFSPDGSFLYYSRVTPKGTELLRVAATGGEPQVIAFLGQGAARDFALSPDGSKMVYVLPPPKGKQDFVLGVVALERGEAQVLLQEANDHLSPIWHPQGDRITYSTIGDGAGLGSLSLETGAAAKSLASPPGRMDLPLAWTLDGAYLALRSLKGTSSANVTADEVVIVSAHGEQRFPIAVAGYVEFIGWRIGPSAGLRASQ